MATGMVLSVAQTLFAALQCRELKELCSNFKYDSQLQTLRGTVKTIQNVLLDAESKKQELNHQELDWVNQLKDVVYDADDLFDKFTTVAQRQRRMPGGNVSKTVRAFFSNENQLLFVVRTSRRIKEIREKLDSIAKDHAKFGFRDVYRPVKRKVDTWSYVHEDSIIGRDADKEAIMGMLLRETDSLVDNISFVSIVGMGGIGKTALAQLVYNDVKINDKFDLKLWVCVSDEFSIEEILCKMLKSINGQDHGDIGVDGLQNKVRQRIEGKKYFLILDDLWNESRDEWLKLREFLQVGARGSRVVVTTRSKKVAGAIGVDPMYTLRGLSDDDSWLLFMKVAFNQGGKEVDDDLVDIGKKIVKKCANVPLAIRVVGSMLYGQEKSKWKLFQRAELPEMDLGEESIMTILKFSYYYLPPLLKSCFSYCALFPKDYYIKKELLIRLWSAQGYLKPINDMQTTEDVGEEYFSILLQRCFLQDVVYDATYGEVGAISRCKMHDLIHDLAQEVAGKELHMIEDSCKCPFEVKTRHLAIPVRRSLLLSSGDTLGNLKGIRTFLRHSDSQLNCESQVTTILAKCRHLRVLDLHNLSIKVLPSTIKNLLHLRYLDLSDNRELKTLPESITRLYNLQVLNLWGCCLLKELPKDLKELVNLRHLDLTNCSGLTHMPAGMDSITSLCTLTQFVLGQESSKKSRIGQLEDLMPLINLRGGLQIIFKEGYEYTSANAEERAYLLNMEHIKDLKIRHEGAWKRKGAVIERSLLERLEPHRDLRVIDIVGYKGVTLPRWAATLAMSLPRLVRISLQHFHDLQQLPALGQLQYLEELRVCDMPNVELMENDNNCAPLFPSLKELFLERCPSLKSFPRCPHVKTFSLWGLNEALTFSKQGDDEANATTPAASSFSASSSSNNDNNSAGDDVFDLWELETDNLGLIKSLFGESLRSIDALTLCNMEVESLSSVVQEFHQKYAISIRSLEFESFRYLKSLSSGGIEHLTNLKTLSLWRCFNLELEEEQEFPWKSLNTLFYLNLSILPKLVHLPRGLQYLTSLRTLSVRECENLETLPEWLDCLKSLRSLTIIWCPKLKLLPEAILPFLTQLYISSCDGLKERYSEPNGTYFDKISHIPSLYLCF